MASVSISHISPYYTTCCFKNIYFASQNIYAHLMFFLFWSLHQPFLEGTLGNSKNALCPNWCSIWNLGSTLCLHSATRAIPQSPNWILRSPAWHPGFFICWRFPTLFYLSQAARLFFSLYTIFLCLSFVHGSSSWQLEICSHLSFKYAWFFSQILNCCLNISLKRICFN